MKHDSNMVESDYMLTVVSGVSRLGSELHTGPQILGKLVHSFAKCSATLYVCWLWFSLFASENWSGGLDRVTTGIRTRTGMNSQGTWILIMFMSPPATLPSLLT